MKYKIYNQDVIEWAKEYKKGKFHALISDAPYHLTSITKRLGKKNSAPAQHGTDGVFSRASKGFMGQTWDGGDVAFRAETWEAICEHLYPGGFGMVFSASRNWHRLAVAIEDAGMIIHPTIFGWLNGQGFPKATNISKQINKRHGATYPDGNLSEMWNGHRYGLQALKPAVEPIIVFQKPYEGKPLDNIVETGAGAINIDRTRIPVSSPVTINRFTNGAKPWGDAKGEEFDTVSTSQGRWPANFIVSNETTPLLDEQSGITKSGAMKHHVDAYEGDSITGFLRGYSDPSNQRSDEGGASRFFFNVQEQIDEADPIYYCGKVSPKERNAGLDNEPEKKSMAQEVLERGGTSGVGNHNPVCQKCGGSKIDRGNGVCKCETPEWLARNTATVRCNHPTMKPIALAKYLATLLLPPEGYAPRRILVPFSGVGSEMIGAMQAGWEQIVGIEFDTENGYVNMAHKRIEYWSNK